MFDNTKKKKTKKKTYIISFNLNCILNTNQQIQLQKKQIYQYLVYIQKITIKQIVPNNYPTKCSMIYNKIKGKITHSQSKKKKKKKKLKKY